MDSRGSSVSNRLGYRFDDRSSILGRGNDGIFSVCHLCVQTFSGSHPASVQWGAGALSPRVKQPEREADHLSPSSAEVKIAWNCTSTTPARLHGVVLN